MTVDGSDQRVRQPDQLRPVPRCAHRGGRRRGGRLLTGRVAGRDRRRPRLHLRSASSTPRGDATASAERCSTTTSGCSERSPPAPRMTVRDGSRRWGTDVDQGNVHLLLERGLRGRPPLLRDGPSRPRGHRGAFPSPEGLEIRTRHRVTDAPALRGRRRGVPRSLGAAR